MKPLVVPPAALRDDNSVQMLSAWIAEEGLHCTLNMGFFAANGHKEAHVWGILIADLVRHIANAQRDETGASVPETIQAVLDGLNAELENPTSDAEGGFASDSN
jgi:hypothetical protein